MNYLPQFCQTETKDRNESFQKERMYRSHHKKQVMWNMKYIVFESRFYVREYRVTQLTSQSQETSYSSTNIKIKLLPNTAFQKYT